MVPISLQRFTSLLLLASTVYAAPAADKPWTGASIPVEVDAVVVGGGYSGAMSAYELHKAGLNTVLLEAKDTLGGKTRSIKPQSNDGIIELGATWINNKTQPEVYKLTQLFGLKTVEQPTDGDTIFQDQNGTVHRTPEGATSETTNAEDGELELMVTSLLAEAADAMDIRRWDDFPEDEDVTVLEWIAHQGLWDSPHVQGLVSRLTTSIVGREPDEIGIHYFLDYVKSGNGLVSLVTEGQDGAQSLKIKEGISAIIKHLTSALPNENIHLNSPVITITQSSNATLVHTPNRVFSAKKVILAIPTNMYHAITFEPALPSSKHALLSATKPGIYAKMLLSYRTPWWRSAGLVGKFASFLGPICFSWDTSNASSNQYSLAIFIAGRIAADWHALPQDQKEPAVLEHLASLVEGYGLAEQALDVEEVNFVEWTNEEWLEGAPTSALGPGVLRKHGSALREPWGDVHFAGTDTAYEWKGYLEGAVTAGQRAAEEVVTGIMK